MENVNSFLFVIATLVTWRITHLLSKEDGPFDIIYLVRKKAGTGFFGKMLDCFYCTSIWTALPLGYWLGNNVWEKILFWLALSGAACLLEQATTKTSTGKNNKQPDYFED